MNIRQINALGLVVCGAISAASVSAQVRCTMPNGRVIEQKLAAVCPVGTVKAQTFDGLPAAIAAPRTQNPPPQVAATPAAPTQPVRPSPVPQSGGGLSSSDMADNATRMCASLKKSGATTCEVDFNAFEPSYIDVTLNIAVGKANEFCVGIANAARDGGLRLATDRRPWELRIRTPFSVRPVAVCSLS